LTKLSVNINKWATLRNARGGNNPNLLQAAKDIQKFGADGITVHPRPDERHIRYQDVRELRPLVHTEFNIEGNPKHRAFIDLVLETKPTQVTLVPDGQDALTSNSGWDTITYLDYLKETIEVFKKAGIRTSIFLNPDPKLIYSAKETGTDRIELYTESYANSYHKNKKEAIKDFIATATVAVEHDLGLNAGHDLDLQNLKFFGQQIPNLLEVSIGHALICDAIYLGLENTVQIYKRQLIMDNGKLIVENG
jgi:pyridoxine 5-phosphate synthase